MKLVKMTFYEDYFSLRSELRYRADINAVNAKSILENIE